MYLPSAPTDEEKYLYLESNRITFYGLGIVSLTSLTLGMILFSLKAPATYIFLIPTAFTSLYLFLNYLIGILGEDFKFYSHASPKLTYKDNHPSVDVYLPCCNEPIEVIENTYKYVSKLHYYGDLKVYVLDDGSDPNVSWLAEKYGFNYIRRENPGELKKAGNLRHAFGITKGEFIVIFDADFCPREDFIEEVIPQFLNDPSIAIVQTPQYFSIDENQTFIEKGAGYIQELFYRMVQVSRNTFGGAICVGTNAIYRRKALEPFGGTAAIGYSEDVHTGFNVVDAGWSLSYIPLNLAKGVCPGQKSAFFTQQYRWAMGSISLLFNGQFWRSNLTVFQKTCYLSGQCYYLATALGVLIAPLPAIIMVWFFPEYVKWYNWLYVVPSLAFGTLFMASWTKAPWGFYALVTRHISNYAHLFAIRDFLKKDLMTWIPTGSTSQTGSSRVKSFVALNLTLGITTFLFSIIGAIYQMTSISSFDFYPLIAFSTFNFIIAMVAHYNE